jgi:hypothetical protein
MRDSTPPHIETYRFGYILIDGRPHDRDVIILPDRVMGRWRRTEGHVLRADDLEAVFKKEFPPGQFSFHGHLLIRSQP